MVNVSNLIIQGKYVMNTKIDNILVIKSSLKNYMAKKKYVPEDMRELFFIDNFLTMTFHSTLPQREPSLKIKLKKNFGLISSGEYTMRAHACCLNQTRVEYPVELRITMRGEKNNEAERIIFEVTSVSAAYYQISQISRNIYLDEFDYSNIEFTNSQFIDEIMSAISAKPLEKPKPLSLVIQSETTKKLRYFGFQKVSDLLENGLSALEAGKNSTGDLLGVIEIFLKQLADRVSVEKEKNQLHKPESNIDSLQAKGKITSEMCAMVKKTLFQGVYLKLKDIDHNKEDINYFDLKLCYAITQNIIEYLLDIIIRFKLKNKKEENEKE